MNDTNQVTGRRKGRFLAALRLRYTRRERHRREGDSSFWNSVGMMGTVGWTVSVPTALGVILGRWIDARLDSAHVFMVFCMLLGLGAGCFTAWRMISEKL